MARIAAMLGLGQGSRPRDMNDRRLDRRRQAQIVAIRRLLAEIAVRPPGERPDGAAGRSERG